MPVYEFRCEDCGRRFELVATLAEKEAGLDPECPKCAGADCRQVFSRVNVMTSSKSDSDTEDLGGEDGGFDCGTGGDEYGDDLGDEPDLD